MTLFQVVGGILTFFFFLLGCGEGEECDHFLPQCISSFVHSKPHFLISQLDYSRGIFLPIRLYFSLTVCLQF